MSTDTKCLVFAALLAMLPAAAPAQITFMRTYGGSGNEDASWVQQTTDGGYIVVGSTVSYGAGRSDVWLVKTDSRGDTIWTRTYGGDSYDEGRCVLQTGDGGYVVAGYTMSFGSGGFDVWLLRTDSLGDTAWTRTYGEGADDTEVAYSVRQTLDGGYVIAGQACKYPADVDAWLIKTDSTGDAVWNRRFDAQGSDLQYAVEQTTDSGYILVGFTGPSPGVCDAWLLKTDEYGDVVWTKTFGGAGDDLAYGVQQAGDGGYVAAGCLELPGSTDAWFIRTDSRGDTIWTRTYGGASYDVASSVQQTRDGGYIVAGYTPSQSGRQDAWLIKTDSFGDTLWTRTFGGENWDYAFAVQQTQDDGYILAGWTESFGAGGSDAWLIKTDSLGNVGVGEGRQTLDARRMTLDIRPNPCAGLATVSLKPQAPSSKPQTLRVYDASGSLVLSRASGVERQATSVVLDLRGQPSGVYTLRLGSVTTRLVVQH